MSEFSEIQFYNQSNPTVKSPNSPYEIQFYQDRTSLMDIETYKNFLQNSISRFRHSRTYKHYKGYLTGLGLDHCQFLGNISNEQATIEMHHSILTIYDDALIITEHILNTKGKISTFDLVQLLKEEHKGNRIPLCMLSLTPHQLYHNTSEMFIHSSMIFGDWYSFLEKYNCGLTTDIAYKLLFYVKRCLEDKFSTDSELLNIRNSILDWSGLNEYNYNQIPNSFDNQFNRTNNNSFDFGVTI